MSDSYSEQFQQLNDEELIEFALEHLGAEYEELRKAALQEHSFRVRNDPDTQVAPPGDTQLLRERLFRLSPPASA